MAQAGLMGRRGLVSIMLAAGAAVPLGAVAANTAPNIGGAVALGQGLRQIEFRANTFTKNNQTDAAVGIDGSGNLLVV
jgi:hypothetical protein